MHNSKTIVQRGFTVVELLIVIVVIGILAALVLNSFAGVQAKARDTKRKTDMNAIATQLEACYNDKCTGSYPTLAQLTDTAANGFVATNLKGFDITALKDSNANTIQSSAPTATVQYQYAPLLADGTTACTTAGSCTSFTLKAWQEQDTANPYTKSSLNK